MKNSCFEPECTSSGYRTCEASILLQWTQNDVWGVLQSISLTFSIKKDAILVLRAWMHYLGVPKLRIWFRNQSIHSTPLDPKWLFGVFWSISETLGKQNDAKLVFRSWMHYFVVPKRQKLFITKAFILLQWTQNHWQCFEAFRKPS
jgi:hypothetical protein